uniref:Uncharacterized protein n=1 Tax=Anas platyrhynchos platyrhynchos TaxID=8840 RepID=A0A493TPD0_ANAPP
CWSLLNPRLAAWLCRSSRWKVRAKGTWRSATMPLPATPSTCGPRSLALPAVIPNAVLGGALRLHKTQCTIPADRRGSSTAPGEPGACVCSSAPP